MDAPVALGRLLGLVLALDEERPVPAAELARRLGTSLRTVYRDVRRLQDAGVPIVSEAGRHGGLLLAPGFRMAPLALTRGETIALTLAIEHLRAVPDLPFAAALDTAARKIARGARVARPELLQQSQRWLRVEPAAHDAFHAEPVAEAAPAATPATAETFIEALLERRSVRIDYRSPYGRNAGSPPQPPRHREYDPGGLMLDRGRWYLVAFASERLDRPRYLRADRVHDCRPGRALGVDRLPPWRAEVQRPWLRDAMRHWIGQAPVRVRVSAEQGERLARDWYFGCGQLAPRPDGHFDFCWGENDFEQVRRLVAWLGPPARLLSPERWVRRLRQTLAAQARIHGPRHGDPADGA